MRTVHIQLHLWKSRPKRLHAGSLGHIPAPVCFPGPTLALKGAFVNAKEAFLYKSQEEGKPRVARPRRERKEKARDNSPFACDSPAARGVLANARSFHDVA